MSNAGFAAVGLCYRRDVVGPMYSAGIDVNPLGTCDIRVFSNFWEVDTSDFAPPLQTEK